MPRSASQRLRLADEATLAAGWDAISPQFAGQPPNIVKMYRVFYYLGAARALVRMTEASGIEAGKIYLREDSYHELNAELIGFEAEQRTQEAAF